MPSVYAKFEITDLEDKLVNAAIFWDMATGNPYVNRHFEGRPHLHLQGRKWAGQETDV
jgi:hypothetical protein